MIVLDVESTGINPEAHSILSIGALDLEEPTNQFYDECRIWDGARVDDEALAINGFTRDEITDSSRKSEAELIQAFIAWAMDRPQNRTLAAQNVTFDRSFVEAACTRAGVEYPFAYRTIDVHSMVWLHMTQNGITPPLVNHHSALNMTAGLEYVGLPEEPKPHNALTGALCHAEIISRVAYNKKLLPEFSTFPIPWLKN